MGLKSFSLSDDGFSSGMGNAEPEGVRGVQGVTANQFNLLREKRLQTNRGLQLKVLDLKNEALGWNVKTEEVNVKKAKVGYKIANVELASANVDLKVAGINLETHKLQLPIAQERYKQGQIELAQEKFKTGADKAEAVMYVKTRLEKLEQLRQDLIGMQQLNRFSHENFQPQNYEFNANQSPAQISASGTEQVDTEVLDSGYDSTPNVNIPEFNYNMNLSEGSSQFKAPTLKSF